MEVTSLSIIRFMNLARLMRGASTCSSKHAVGAVLLTESEAFFPAANGVASGFLSCDYPVVGNSCIVDSHGRCTRALHAEVNAILAAAKAGEPTDGAHMYVTLPPCANCVQIMRQAGITELYYIGSATSSNGLEMALTFMRVMNLNPTYKELMLVGPDDLEWYRRHMTGIQFDIAMRGYEYDC